MNVGSATMATRPIVDGIAPAAHPPPLQTVTMNPHPVHDPSLSEDLLEQVEREQVRYTIQHVYKTQTTTPLGWLLVLGLVSTRTSTGPTMIWIAAFGALLLFILVQLRRLRSRPQSHARKVAWLHGLAALDGLGWGVMPHFVFGADANLDSWLVTVLCGVAAINAPPRALLPTAYATQLAALWVPVALFGFEHRHMDGAVQMIIGLAVFMALLLFYVRSVERVMSNNILLRLQNADLSAQLQLSLTHVEREASTDPLTEQANRREMNRVLLEVDRRRRSLGGTYSLLMLDIDHFKQVNDRFGHDVGDETLKAFSRRVSECLRPTDLLARTGGEEFTVLLRDATLAEATVVARRICETVAATPLLQEPLLNATVSIGVAEQRGHQSPAEVAKCCDVAVYEAKRSGRNRVSVAAAC
jgi:diguanylate cyclase (GGDEF)-like protein